MSTGRYLAVWTDQVPLLAKEPRDLIGRAIDEVLGEELGRPFHEAIRRVVATGKSETIEYSLDVIAGRCFFIADVVRLPEYDCGSPSAGMIIRDVTALKRAELELQLAQARLASSERMSAMGTLAVGIAHEVNNPLGFVLVNLEVLASSVLAARDDAARAEAAAIVIETLEGVKRIRDIVVDVKLFARSDDQQGQVDPNRVVESALRIARGDIRAHARLVVDLRPIPIVTGSAPKLGQVVLNLLINATHAVSNPQSLSPEVLVSTTTTKDGRAEIVVADTGEGIAREHLPRIFDAFFTTKPAASGSGLGLFICREIVTSFGGTIDVESEPGRGSTFRVILPSA